MGWTTYFYFYCCRCSYFAAESLKTHLHELEKLVKRSFLMSVVSNHCIAHYLRLQSNFPATLWHGEKPVSNGLYAACCVVLLFQLDCRTSSSYRARPVLLFAGETAREAFLHSLSYHFVINSSCPLCTCCTLVSGLHLDGLTLVVVGRSNDRRHSRPAR